MTHVIDASVFVSSSRIKEPNSHTSIRFIESLQQQGQAIYGPALVIVECVAAIARSTGEITLATEIITLIKSLPNLQLVDITVTLADKAALIAMQHRLRGADAIYVALAFEVNATLVTWDNEMLVRGAPVVKTITPADWLTQNK